MKQRTLAMMTGFEQYTRKTRRAIFLEEMEQVVPWGELCALVAPHYPQPGKGRRPVGVERMLRIYFLQQWFNLSDPAVEETLYDSGEEPDEVEGALEGGTRVCGDEAEVRICEATLSRTEEECYPTVRGVRAGESVLGAEKTVALGTGLARERRLLITGQPPKQAEDRKKPNPSACTGLAEHLLPQRHELIQSFPSLFTSRVTTKRRAGIEQRSCTAGSLCRKRSDIIKSTASPARQTPRRHHSRRSRPWH